MPELKQIPFKLKFESQLNQRKAKIFEMQMEEKEASNRENILGKIKIKIYKNI